jgi:hypothetical protein
LTLSSSLKITAAYCHCNDAYCLPTCSLPTFLFPTFPLLTCLLSTCPIVGLPIAYLPTCKLAYFLPAQCPLPTCLLLSARCQLAYCLVPTNPPLPNRSLLHTIIRYLACCLPAHSQLAACHHLPACLLPIPAHYVHVTDCPWVALLLLLVPPVQSGKQNLGSILNL